jgi:tetratricopeptide (TPR) repeat protein
MKNEEPKNRRTKEPDRRSTRHLVLWFLGSWNFFLSGWLHAQDIVVTSPAADPAVRVKKAGQILDYTGMELKLRTTLGVNETIPASRVVEIQTRWSPAHEAGRKARQEGRLNEAIAALRQAKREEPRAWAVRQIMADLSGACLDAGQIEGAGDEFLAIVASDPATPHINVIPMAWRAVAIPSPVEARASAWLAARQTPLAVVLGASWLLATRRAEAGSALEEIARSTEARLASLATIQLWRTKLITASADDARRWQVQLEKMPPEIQTAGWYVLGDIFARLDQPQAAALAYLKIPILFRQQRAMAAEALLAAGEQLEKMSQAAQAADLYRELVRDFAHLAAAQEAQARLQNLQRTPPAPR